MELVGWLEHLTCWLRISCSTDWATLAYLIQRSCLQTWTTGMIPHFFRIVNRNLCCLLPSIQPLCILQFVFLQEYLRFFTRRFLLFQRVSTDYFCQWQKTIKFCSIDFYKNYTLSQNFNCFFGGSQPYWVYVIFCKAILYQKLFTFSTWFSTSV